MLIKDENVLSAAALLLSLAVQEVLPDALFAGSYFTDTGFGMRMFTDVPLDIETITAVEERLQRLCKKNLIIEPVAMMRENASQMFVVRGQPYLAENIEGQPDAVVSLGRIEDFYFPASVGEALSSAELGYVKVIGHSLASAKHPGCKKQTVVTIDGVVADTSKNLKEFLKKYKEVAKHDHRLLGPQLGLFCWMPDQEEGEVAWLPKGEYLREHLLSLLRTWHQEEKLCPVRLPLWTEKMPVACLSDRTAAAWMLFQQMRQSGYKGECRWSEIREVYVPDQEKKRKGLFSKSFFTKDTAFIFTPFQIAKKDLISSLQFILKSINIFDIDYRLCLDVKRPQSTVDRRSWDQGVALLTEALHASGLTYTVNSKENRGFYPCVSVLLADSIGREWSGPRLECSCAPVARESEDTEAMVLVSRSLFGSLEGFIAFLLERYAGVLPVWLAPVQVRVIPVSEKHGSFADAVCNDLLFHQIRAERDRSEDHLGARVFAAKAAKIPYVLIVGDKEQKRATVAVCPYAVKGEGQEEKLEAFIERTLEEMQPMFLSREAIEK